MTTDWKALCAELHAAFNTYAVDEVHHALLERARAALDQPEPEGPTEAQILEAVRHLYGDQTAADMGAADDLLTARAVLARWGRPAPQPATDELTAIALQMLGTIEDMKLIIPEITDTIRKALEQNRPTPQPVPVAERLPGPGDCDEERRCWWWRSDGVEEFWELICLRDPIGHNSKCAENVSYGYWLPFDALPLPTSDDEP